MNWKRAIWQCFPAPYEPIKATHQADDNVSLFPHRKGKSTVLSERLCMGGGGLVLLGKGSFGKVCKLNQLHYLQNFCRDSTVLKAKIYL